MSSDDDDDDSDLWLDIRPTNQKKTSPAEQVPEKKESPEKSAKTVRILPTKKIKTRKTKRVFNAHEKALMKMEYYKMTNEEEDFLRSLDTIDRLWGYERRSNYEQDTHEILGIVGLQKFTDPIFRIIAKLKKRSKTDQFYEVGGDIYGKIKQQSLNLPVNKEISKFVRQIMSKKDGFAEEIERLAQYSAKSFPMKMITECASALVMIADPKGFKPSDLEKRVLQNERDVKFLSDHKSLYNKKKQTANKWNEVEGMDSPDRLRRQRFATKIRRKTKFDTFLPKIDKSKKILFYSNPDTVREKAEELGYPEVVLSTRKEKKYMIVTPQGETVHFGQMGYEDYTKHKDEKRRQNYLTRSSKIRGDWESDAFSPNTLARKLLW